MERQRPKRNSDSNKNVDQCFFSHQPIKRVPTMNLKRMFWRVVWNKWYKIVKRVSCLIVILILATYLMKLIQHNLKMKINLYNIVPKHTIDPNGYVVFCPCMGRFGNQADMYLGALSFSKAINRTMILPPWIEFPPQLFTSVMIPFDTYFKVEPLLEYTRVITMEKFMKEASPSVWPQKNRKVMCYGTPRDDKEKACHHSVKDGNPFGPFWDNFHIDFVGSEYYGSLDYTMESAQERDSWTEKFPGSKYKVLAFSGAPGAFPVRGEDEHVQKYFHWSDKIMHQAEDFIEDKLVRPFLGLHMRNGEDWDRVCEDIDDADPWYHHLFSSANCLGQNMDKGPVYFELCKPKRSTVIKQVKKAVKAMKAKSVFVASDDDHMIEDFEYYMPRIKFVHLKGDKPHVDLAILGQADHAIVNCISTFSSFAVRERKLHNRSIEFWAFPKPQTKQDDTKKG